MKLVTPQPAKLTVKDHLAAIEKLTAQSIRELGSALNTCIEVDTTCRDLLKIGQQLQELQHSVTQVRSKL